MALNMEIMHSYAPLEHEADDFLIGAALISETSLFDGLAPMFKQEITPRASMPLIQPFMDDDFYMFDEAQDTDSGSFGSGEFGDVAQVEACLEEQRTGRAKKKELKKKSTRPRIYTMVEPVELKKLDIPQLRVRERELESQFDKTRHKHRKGLMCPRCTAGQRLKQIKRVIMKREGVAPTRPKKEMARTISSIKKANRQPQLNRRFTAHC